MISLHNGVGSYRLTDVMASASQIKWISSAVDVSIG
jgi:hypothetical protein